MIAGAVTGLATFRENLTKLFGGFQQPRIVFKAEGVSYDPSKPTMRALSVLDFAPTDSSYHVQEITFRYPSKLEFGPETTSHAVRFDLLLQKVQPLLLVKAQVGRPDNLVGTRCRINVPVVIDSDFIDQRSTRHLDESMYYLDVEFDAQVEPFPFANALIYDHPIGIFESREKTLDLAFAQANASCHDVQILPEFMRTHQR